MRHAVIPFRPKLLEKHLNYISSISHLRFVSYIDFSYGFYYEDISVHSNHLEQLAVVCPNLQRLNLQGSVNCLKDLQGLRAIVNTCQP